MKYTKFTFLTAILFAFALILGGTGAFAADGKATYEANCQKCHGADGKGQTKMGQKLGAKDYSTAAAWDALKPGQAEKAVTEGVKDKDGKVVMKPTEGATDATAKDVIAYMKTLKR